MFSKGSSEIDRLLLFRDHLRADPQARARHLAAKREPAERTWHTIQDDTDAKSEVLETIIEDARSSGSAAPPDRGQDDGGDQAGERQDGLR